MSDLAIQRVATSRQQRQFLEFPWTLYRDDPNWIPPLRGTRRKWSAMPAIHSTNVIDRKHSWPTVAARYAVASPPSSTSGHIERYNDPRGFFGFFECRDDQEAAHGLFDACRGGWPTQGIHRLRGPANPSLNYEVGLLVDGFDSPPTFMMTYNPPYYERLLENYGFRKTQDLYAFWGHI